MLVIAVGGASGFAWERYDLKTSFADVQGLKSGAIVRVAGVEVGKVTDVGWPGPASRSSCRSRRRTGRA